MEETPGSPPDEGTRLIHLGVGAFVATCALLFLAATIVPRESDAPFGFSLSPVAETQPDGTFQVTLDTSDNEKWVPFSLELGRVVPRGPAADLYLRRQLLQAPFGALELGQVALTTAAPPASAEWVPDVIVDEVKRNPVLSNWYDYSYFSHLLSSKDNAFAVHLAGGGTANVRVLSYYCDNETSGCMTLQYRVAEPT
jgi:hypothetical protein